MVKASEQWNNKQKYGNYVGNVKPKKKKTIHSGLSLEDFMRCILACL